MLQNLLSQRIDIKTQGLSPGDLVITDNRKWRPSVWSTMEGNRPIGNAVIDEIASNKKMLVISYTHPSYVYVLVDDTLGYVNIGRISKVII